MLFNAVQGFVDILRTSNSQHAGIAHPDKHIYGLQFHPEVTHSPLGKDLLRNFAVGICKAPTDWNMLDIADEFIREVCLILSVYIAE
jgi:GMP synthase (glutamine-hydrolysing)